MAPAESAIKEAERDGCGEIHSGRRAWEGREEDRPEIQTSVQQMGIV